MFKKSSAAFIFIGLLVGLQTTFAAAVELNQYSVKIDPEEHQVQFEFTADGKTPLENSILLTNVEKTKAITLKLEGVDAATNNLGVVMLNNSSDAQSRLGKWIQFSEPTVTLQPLQQKYVKFSINLPEKITPGTYIGGISVADVTEHANTTTIETKGFGAKIATRLVKKVLVSVPGEKVTKYAFNNFQFNQSKNSTNFTFDITNQGNTLISAKGDLTVTDKNSGKVYDIPVSVGGVLQEDTFNGRYDWSDHSKWGNYEAKLNLDLFEYNPFTQATTKIDSVNKQINLSLSDYTSLIPYGVALIILILIIVIYIVNNRIYLSKCTTYIVGENETIKTIADKFQMNWKKLAKINKIKAPYEIHTGNSILVKDKTK